MDLAKEEILKEIQQKLAHTLPQVQGIPCVPISALYRKGFNKLIKAIFVTEELWNTRVSTGTLNRWLEKATERHPPPLAGNSRIRLKYITQIKSRPPTFALFISKPADLPKSYLKYLTNDLRQAFHLPGVPLRLVIRKGKNPYQS
jgi:GTP-binding protein